MAYRTGSSPTFFPPFDEVESLYSTLFDFSAAKVEENGAQLIPLAGLVNESPFEDLAEAPEEDGKSVFIVCEAQMVTDALREDEMLKFGSGRLLSDLLSHLGIDKGSGNKVVFVGDKYELSFGSWSDSCLNPDWYRGSMATEEIELPDIANPDGIQAACLDIADAIRTGRMTNLVLEQNEQIRICEPQEEAQLLRGASENWRRHKVLSYTNGQAQGLNGYIKRRIRWQRQQMRGWRRRHLRQPGHGATERFHESRPGLRSPIRGPGTTQDKHRRVRDHNEPG